MCFRMDCFGITKQCVPSATENGMVPYTHPPQNELWTRRTLIGASGRIHRRLSFAAMLLKQVVSSVLAPAFVALATTTGYIPSDVLLNSDSSASTAASSSNLLATTPNSVVKSPTEDYLPRRLYPGTYQNYCGPTPEVDRIGGCVAHGWHGDDPADAVDAACRLHDVSYCQCEAALLDRKQQADESIPMLSALTALRFATRPAMNTAGVDAAYYDCIHKADQRLIATGLTIRGNQQRTACSTDPALSWFCGKSEGSKDTLGAFEKVSLNIFLKSLDDDENPGLLAKLPYTIMNNNKQSVQSSSVSLSALEKQRSLDLQRVLKSGKTIAEAASSPEVMRDEQELLRRLGVVTSEANDMPSTTTAVNGQNVAALQDKK
eukprot:scaffold5314_cov167-Amphora_coffeaeformis.AAC.7